MRKDHRERKAQLKNDHLEIHLFSPGFLQVFPLLLGAFRVIALTTFSGVSGMGSGKPHYIFVVSTVIVILS